MKILVVVLALILLSIHSTLALAQSADLNPTASQESCTKDQADSGNPQSCTVGPYSGHDYLRYIRTDDSGNLFCQRSLCLNDSNNQPFEYKCSKDQADGLQPQDCKDSSGNNGLSYDRYSFTDSTGQLWCYKSECIVTTSLSPTTTPSPVISSPPVISLTPVPTEETSDEIAMRNLNVGLLPPNFSKDVQPVGGDPFWIFFWKRFTSLLGFLVIKGGIFTPRTDLQNSVTLPDEVRPTPPINDLPQQAAQNIGEKGNAGIYSANLPKVIRGKDDKPAEVEKQYEKAYFPTGICPITDCR